MFQKVKEYGIYVEYHYECHPAAPQYRFFVNKITKNVYVSVEFINNNIQKAVSQAKDYIYIEKHYYVNVDESVCYSLRCLLKESILACHEER